MNLNEYLLTTIKQLGELTSMALSVELSADQLHEIMKYKTEATLNITKAVNPLASYIEKK